MSQRSVSAARGGMVTLVGQAARIGVQLVALVVLARFVSPADYGLVAMVAILIALGDLLRDFGMATAALQAPSLTHQQASNLFWLNSAMGLGVTAVVALSAPLVAAFYDETRLLWLTPVLAVSLLLGALQVQFQVQMARDLRFEALVISDVASQAVAVSAAIWAATAGWGYWALALQYVLTPLCTLVARVLQTGWRPGRPRRGSNSMGMIRSGGNLGSAQLIGFAASNADTVMIGATWDASDLGYYDRAFKLHSLPIIGLLAPLTNLVLPILNRARDQGRDTHALLLRLQTVVGMLIATLYAVGAATAPALIGVTLGPDWSAVTPLFAILCLGSTLHGLSFVNYWAYVHVDQTRELLRSNLITKSVSIAIIVGAALISVRAVAIGYAAGLLFTWLFATWFMGMRTPFRSAPIYLNGLQVLASGAVAAGVGRVVVIESEPLGVVPQLGLGGGSVLLCITAATLVLPAPRREVTHFVRSRRAGTPV